MATIIKAGQRVPKDLGGAPAALDLDDFTQQARASLDQVRAEAAQILQQARDEAQAVLENARQQGYQAGLAQADAELNARVAAQLKEPLTAIRLAAEQITSARQDWLSHWQQAAIHVATAIAARVVRREVADNPQITLDLVAEALRLAAGSDEVTLRLHPQDAERLGPQLEVLIGNLNRLAPASVVADESIEPGGCRVETRLGTIDQQFSAQLERIETELQ